MTSPSSRYRQILFDIRQAIQGSQEDYTKGSIRRAVVLLAIPMILEMVMESVFAVTDVFFVSRLGAEAVATVGMTESVLSIIYAIAIGLGMGTTALVARRIGEKRPEDAASTAVQAVLVGIVASIPIALLGMFAGNKVLAMMGASPEIIESGSMYTSIMLGSNVVIMLLFVINAAFRSAGDAAIAMRVLWLANILNVVLDPCLIFGLGPFPELGVKGAAVATAIGRGTGVLVQFYALFRGGNHLLPIGKFLRPRLGLMFHLVRVSLGAIGQWIIATSSWVGLVRIMATFGADILAGYTIAIRVLMFTLLPSWGLSNAAATLVGQNLGAGEPDRAEKSVWITGGWNTVFLVLVSISCIVFARDIIGIFTAEPAVLAAGATSLRYMSYGYVAWAVGMVVIQAFNGAGDTVTPTIINFFCFWMLELPLAYVLALKLGFEERGVLISMICSESMVGIVSVIVFRRGKWKTREV